MAQWSVEFSVQADKDLSNLDPTTRQRVIQKIEWLSSNFKLVTPLPLTGEFRDFYKLRIGDWRAVYVIDWKLNRIIVRYIDHRSKIYTRR